MTKKILFIFAIIFSLSFIGFGCAKQATNDQAGQVTPTTTTVVVKENVCALDGKIPGDRAKCCVGLEMVAVDNAYSVCGKPGSGYKPKGCMNEGESPFVDTPKCCANLEPILKGDKYLCTKKITKDTTTITYYLLAKSEDSSKYCNGENMNSPAYKQALSKKMTKIVSNSLTVEERIKITLNLAAERQSFNQSYTRIASTTFANGILTMNSASGWSGVSIFYCAWKPFVEKNLEQFAEVKEIKWQAG